MDLLTERLSSILNRWLLKQLTQTDADFLDSTEITQQQYSVLTDSLKFRRGAELVGNRLVLTQSTTAVHEGIMRGVEGTISEMYGRDLVAFESSTMYYEVGCAKQPNKFLLP
jgi:hypothetical protein